MLQCNGLYGLVCVCKNTRRERTVPVINEKKVRLMTKAEMIKKQNRRELFNTRKFFASDFVTFGMLKAAVGATIAYVFVVLLVFLNEADTLLSEITVTALIDLAVRYVRVYALILVVTMIISVIIWYRIYKRSSDALRQYREVIRELNEESGQ